MKKYHLLALLLLACTFAQAQLQRGTYYIGVPLKEFFETDYPQPLSLAPAVSVFSTMENNIAGWSSTEYVNRVFNPEFGVMLSNRFMLGMGQQTRALGIFGRYYFNPDAAGTHVFAQTGKDLTTTIQRGKLLWDFNMGIGVTQLLGGGIAWDNMLGFYSGPVDGRSRAEQLALTTRFNVYLSQELRNESPDFQGFSLGRRLMIGGGAGDFKLGFGDDKLNSVDARASILYFVSNRLALGAGFTYQHLSRVRPVSQDFSRNNWGIMPQLRLYSEGMGRTRWFAGLGAGLMRYKLDAQNEFIDADLTAFNMEAGYGFNHFVTPNFALEFFPFVGFMSENDDASTKTFRLGASLGVQVLLPAK